MTLVPTRTSRWISVRGRGPFRRILGRVGRIRDRGMVTAEIAVALPALFAVLAIAIGAVSAVTGQLRCVDAAREGARAAARGEAPDDVIRIATAAAPQGGTVTVTSAGDQITVLVAADIDLIGDLGPSIDVSASAVALAEPAMAVPPRGDRPAPLAAAANGGQRRAPP